MRPRIFAALVPLVACAPRTPPDHTPPREETRIEPAPKLLPALDAGSEPATKSEPSFWHLVVDSPLPEISVAPFDRFAVITTRSLFLVVDGERVSQDPRFLAGLPEWVNWDANVSLDVPSIASIENGLPVGALHAGHAGNRHGPDFSHWWTKQGWSSQAPKADPRLKKLPKAATAYFEQIELALPSGELVVLRYDAEIESFVLPPSGAPRRSVVSTAPGIRHLLFGEKPDDLYLCETNQGVFHFDGKAWSAIETDRTPSWCARTSDGVLWMVVDPRASEPATVVARRGSEWSEVPLPAGTVPETIAASGNRVWVTASSRVYSNQKVAETVTFDERSLPGPVWIDGITGLDVTSVDVVSVSANPAGPGTSACTSLVAWLGEKLTPELEQALGTPRPRVVQTAGIVPGSVAPSGNGSSQMTVVPSGKKRMGVAALPKTHSEGVELVKRVKGARLLCAEPRIVRDL